MKSRRESLKTIACILGASALAPEQLLAHDENAEKPTGNPAAPQIAKLMQQAVGNLEDAEVTVVTVDYPPGGSSSPHRHPGPVFGYILEGSVVSQLKGSPEKTYAKGEMFYEPSGAVHLISRNASKSEPAKLLAFMIAKRGAPVKLPVLLEEK
jgi:quercetin dioxygenase-like cupin family protein